MQVLEGPFDGQSIRQCRDREAWAQLDKRIAPAQVESAHRTSKDRHQKN